MSDEGHVAEFTPEGGLVKRRALAAEDSRVGGGDFEGITYNPATGLVYVAIEGRERILEVSPDDFSLLRVFDVERSFGGRLLLKPGGQGIEAMEFIPDSTDPDGGIFYLANQAFDLEDQEDPSVILRVRVPLRDSADGDSARIESVFYPGIIDIAGFHYDPESGHLLALSDATNSLHEFTLDGQLVRGWSFPGVNQEGVTTDGNGTWFIAQDSGGIIRMVERGSTANEGFVTVPRWGVVGPFDSGEINQAELSTAPRAALPGAFADHPAAAGWDASATFETRGGSAGWQALAVNNRGRADIAEILGRESDALAFATFAVRSPSAQTVRATIGVNDMGTLTLNGEPVGGDVVYQLSQGEALVRLNLREGWNTVTARVVNLGAAWWIRMQLQDPEGQLQFALSPQ